MMEEKSEEEAVKEFRQWLAEVNRKEDRLKAQRTTFLVSLIKARHQKHLSQTELAQLVNKPQSVISRIESGKGNPGLDTLLAIAKALDVNLVVE